MIGVGSRQHRTGGDACLVWNYLAGIDMNVMRAHTEGSFGCLVGAASPSSDRYECHECARGGQLRWFDVQQQNNVCGDGLVQKSSSGTGTGSHTAGGQGQNRAGRGAWLMQDLPAATNKNVMSMHTEGSCGGGCRAEAYFSV